MPTDARQPQRLHDVKSSWHDAEMASTKKLRLGPAGRQVALNLRDLRKERGRVSVYDLAKQLEAIGWPIQPSGLTRIEREERRVDVDDLVALAVALGVNPSALLFPRRIDDGEEIDLTPAVSAKPWLAWAWADGQIPLPGEGDPKGSAESRDLLEFELHSRPHGDEPGPDAIDTMRRLTYYLLALAEEGDDMERRRQRVDSIRRTMERLNSEVMEFVSRYPTSFPAEALETDEGGA